MKLINLTSQAVLLYFEDNTLGLRVPPSGECAWITTHRVFSGQRTYDGTFMPIYREQSSQVQGLPVPSPDTDYIVPEEVRKACPDRDDLLSVGEPVTSTRTGEILGYIGLVRNEPES